MNKQTKAILVIFLVIVIAVISGTYARTGTQTLKNSAASASTN
jgi:hypothetical protein